MLGSQLIISYGLAAVGGVLIVLAVFDAMRRRLNIEAANTQVIKLARAGNLERASKLCMAASGTYLDAIGAAIERSAGPVDRSALDIAVNSAFDDLAKPAAARWLRMNERGLLGVIAVGGGLALAFSMDVRSTALETAAGLAALAAIWLLARRSYYAKALAAARAEVLPAIIEARLAATTTAAPSAAADASPATDAFARPSGATPGVAAVFRVFRGDRLIETRPLTRNIIKIGRMAAANFCITGDEGVSRMHAIVEIEREQIQIIDLGSSTGTFVNGKKINKAVLHDGDQVLIGATRLQLSLSGSEPLAPATTTTGASSAALPPTTVDATAPIAPDTSTLRASLASGTCPLCQHTVIKTVAHEDPRFRSLVCASCGYAQEFATLDTLD